MEKIPSLPTRKDETPEQHFEAGRRYGAYQAVSHIQYVLTYGLEADVTEKEIEKCEELMKVFLTTHKIQGYPEEKKNER